MVREYDRHFGSDGLLDSRGVRLGKVSKITDIKGGTYSMVKRISL